MKLRLIHQLRRRVRLACTALVYRSYHSVGEVAFELQPHAGRHCLSAEDLLNQAVGRGWFTPVRVFGVHGDEWVEGAQARTILQESYAATFEVYLSLIHI